MSTNIPSKEEILSKAAIRELVTKIASPEINVEDDTLISLVNQVAESFVVKTTEAALNYSRWRQADAKPTSLSIEPCDLQLALGKCFFRHIAMSLSRRDKL